VGADEAQRGRESGSAGPLIACRITIPTDPFYCEGHFPGAPVVPAYVLLNFALAEAKRLPGWAGWCGSVQTAKFLAPVQPGDELELNLVARAPDRLNFELRRGATLVAEGRLIRGEAAT